VTDEDSDRPYYAANRYSDQTSEDPPATWPASPTNGWVLEVGDTAQAAIDQEAFINILMNRGDAPSVHQYGDPNLDVSDPDFSDFDPAATLANLVAANLQGSLEGQLLAAGLVGRTFDITKVTNPGFIDNFFSAKVEEITESIVPEPVTVAGLALGVGALATYIRRRRAA